jgi:hypothetical protein
MTVRQFIQEVVNNCRNLDERIEVHLNCNNTELLQYSTDNQTIDVNLNIRHVQEGWGYLEINLDV